MRKPLNVPKLRRDIEGRKVTAVRRRGKTILVELSGDRVILIHLGMTGACRVCDGKTPLEKHEHVIFTLSAGQSWRFHDPRRFDMVQSFRRNGEGTLPRYLRLLGPEPLADGFDGEYLFKIARKRKRSIKELLLDQRPIAGIGNIYASESLFRAGVRPRRAAGRLNRRECNRIVRATRNVLRQAIAAGGTTVSDYRQVDGSEGKFKQKLRVYARTDLPCVTCKTPIKRIVQGGRSSWYCPVCQK